MSPFVVGRATVYDEGLLEDFFGQGRHRAVLTPRERGSSTQITLTTTRAPSSTCTARRIIEPNLTVYYAGSTLNQTELPVYDERVESLATGSVVKAWINQTLQISCGGPGRWRNVDWLYLRRRGCLLDR